VTPTKPAAVGIMGINMARLLSVSAFGCVLGHVSESDTPGSTATPGVSSRSGHDCEIGHPRS